MSKNLSYLTGRKGVDENLFNKIGDAAKEKGTVSKDKMTALAHDFLIGKANLKGATSFYDFTREENKNKEIYICNGSACMCAGTQDKLKKSVEKFIDTDKIGAMTCLGRCYENKALFYKGKNYSGLEVEALEGIMNGHQIKIKPTKYNTGNIGKAVLTRSPLNLDQFEKILEKTLRLGSDNALDQITASNLRGRGGAGFPISLKLDSCRQTPSDVKFVVCNADEGDPGAYSDKYLMEEQPLSLLLGMMIAGQVIGAQWGLLYIRKEYPESIKIIQEKIDLLRDLKLIGKHIVGSDFDFDFKIIYAQGAYICGEETALLSSIEGQRPEVRIRPPFPTQEGLFRKPTVVNNVETLAALPYILDNGGKSYAALGTSKSSGTKLVSLDSFFVRPGIYEVEMGTPLSQVIEELGGGFNAEIKALHIGGPLGGLVPVEKINALNVDFESFSEGGFLLGHASIVCIPRDFSILKYVEHLFAFTAHESCGKCFPCRLGSVRGQELLEGAIKDGKKIDRDLFVDLLDTLEQGSLCALGGGLPLPIRNAMMYFEDEFDEVLA